MQAPMPFKRIAQKIQELDPTNGANETNQTANQFAKENSKNHPV